MNRTHKQIFITLFFSLFATITGVGIVVPLLPVYASDLGAKGIYIGLIFGAFSISRSMLLPYFGRRSDREGRKPFITLGLFGYTLISFAFMLSKDVNVLIIIRFIQGIASAMIMPVVQAYVGDITAKGKEGITMGVFNISTFLGLSLGPLLGGVIKDHWGLNSAFACMGALAGIGFLMSLIFLPPVAEEQVVQQGRPPVAWMILLKNRVITGLFSFRFAYTACIGMTWGFLPVYADIRFSLSSSAIGVLVMLGVLTSGILQTPMGHLADRLNRRMMVILGGLVVAGAMTAFKYAGGFWELFFANLVFGLGGGISLAPFMALAVEQGNASHAMGSVMALLTLGHSLGMMSGSLLAGGIMDFVALRQVFVIGALIMGAGVLCFFLLTLNPSAEKGLRESGESG